MSSVRGGGRALRVARRVVDREPALEAEAAEHGLHQVRATHRDERSADDRADHEHERTARDGQHGRAEEEPEQAQHHEGERPDRALARQRARLGGGVAQRLDGLDPRRPPRREHHGEVGDQRAGQHRLDHLRGLDLDAAARQVETEGAEHRHEHEGEPGADDHTEGRADEADHQTFVAQRPLDLFRCGPDRREHRQLALALSHDDAERVVDHERTDEQRQGREELQAGLQEPADRACLVALVGEEGVTGLDPVARRREA